jgi:bacterioferritin
MNTLREINKSQDVKNQLDFDLKKEMEMLQKYRDGIILCGSEKDFITQELLTDLAEDEEDHVKDIEKQISKIEKMGIDNYYSKKA